MAERNLAAADSDQQRAAFQLHSFGLKKIQADPAGYKKAQQAYEAAARAKRQAEQQHDEAKDLAQRMWEESQGPVPAAGYAGRLRTP
jgi:hypothetical protein